MAYLIAQLSDIHIGGPSAGSGDRFSEALDEINAMSRQPDLVLLTGDLTHDATAEQWQECRDRLDALTAPWEAIAGNHDRKLTELRGHRAIDAGPLRLVLVDSADDSFADADADWLHSELNANPEQPTVIAIHHPPFDTGIWWMDCVGLKGSDRFQSVVAEHPQVIKVLSGHVHRTIQTQVGACSFFVCPSTAVTVAVDLDEGHDPAESAEGPMFALHAWTGSMMVSHVVPVGSGAKRAPIAPHAGEFVAWARDIQRDRPNAFADA